MARERATAAPPAPARYYAMLCDIVAALGVDVPALLRAARIAPAEIRARDGVLSARQVEALVAHAGAMAGRDDLGFELGRRIKLSSHDILGYAMISSSTLDQAFRLCARYYPLITPTFRVRYERGVSHATYHFDPIIPMSPDTLRFHTETIVAATHEALVALLGRHLRPYDLHICGLAPAHRRRYRALVPARVRFDSGSLPGSRFVIETAQVDRPLPMADPGAVAMAEARCAALLQHITQSGSVAGWVEMMLREAHDGLPTLGELAHVLRITPRTLDRRLRREGHGFLELSNRVRHERACELLRRRDSTVTQAAYELGYRDVANFSRAFRRLQGTSPGEFQRRQRPAATPGGHGRRPGRSLQSASSRV